MPFMILEIPDVAVHQRLVALHDQQVFGIPLFGRLGEVEGAGDQGAAVDDHDLVVGNGMGRVDKGGDAGMGDEVCRGVFLPALAPVQDRFDPDPPLAGIHEGLCDRPGGEGICLKQDLTGGGIDLSDDGLGGLPPW